jgi:hypothetical protein
VRERLEAIGTCLGPRFAVNLARSGGWKLPVGLTFNHSLDDSRCGDREKAPLYWARRGIKLMKFGFATFRCRHSGHGSLLEPCAEEQDLDAFLGILGRVLQDAPAGERLAKRSTSREWLAGRKVEPRHRHFPDAEAKTAFTQ